MILRLAVVLPAVAFLALAACKGGDKAEAPEGETPVEEMTPSAAADKATLIEQVAKDAEAAAEGPTAVAPPAEAPPSPADAATAPPPVEVDPAAHPAPAPAH